MLPCRGRTRLGSRQAMATAKCCKGVMTVCQALCWAPALVPALSPHPPVFEMGLVIALIFQMRKLSHRLGVVADGAGTHHILRSRVSGLRGLGRGLLLPGLWAGPPGEGWVSRSNVRVSHLRTPPSSVSFSYPAPHRA